MNGRGVGGSKAPSRDPRANGEQPELPAWPEQHSQVIVTRGSPSVALSQVPDAKVSR